MPCLPPNHQRQSTEGRGLTEKWAIYILKIGYISPICPRGWICTKFGTAVVITGQIFWWSVKGCGFCGGSKIANSHWQAQSPLTRLALPQSPWCVTDTHIGICVYVCVYSSYCFCCEFLILNACLAFVGWCSCGSTQETWKPCAQATVIIVTCHQIPETFICCVCHAETNVQVISVQLLYEIIVVLSSRR